MYPGWLESNSLQSNSSHEVYSNKIFTKGLFIYESLDMLGVKDGKGHFRLRDPNSKVYSIAFHPFIEKFLEYHP